MNTETELLKSEKEIIRHATDSMDYLEKHNKDVRLTLSLLAAGEARDDRILALLTILIAEQMQHEEQLKELRLRLKDVTRLAGIIDPTQGN